MCAGDPGGWCACPCGVVAPIMLQYGSVTEGAAGSPRVFALPMRPTSSSSGRSRFSPHSFLAGSIAGASGMLIGHPLDTIKTYAQVGRELPVSLRSLFRGVGLQMVMAGSVQAANLGIYENVRRRLEVDPGHQLWPHAVAGTIGGLCIAPVTIPLGRVKVQQQLYGDTFAVTARSIRSTHSLYAGATMMSLFESSRGLYMLCYCILKEQLSQRRPSEALPLWARTLAGAGANMITWGVMYPVTVVGTVQQAEAAATGHSANALTCVRRLCAEEGIGRLYRGYTLTIVRAGPVSAARTYGASQCACLARQCKHIHHPLHVTDGVVLLSRVWHLQVAGVVLPCFEVVLPWLERHL